MFYKHTFTISRRHAPELCVICHSLERKEGAGKTGCVLHPRSRVQIARVRTHTSIQVQRRHPGLPCAMVYGLFRALPGEPCTFATVIPEKLVSQELDASFGASGPRVFTVRNDGIRHSPPSRHCIPPRVRDDRDPPLSSGETGRIVKVICPTG